MLRYTKKVSSPNDGMLLTSFLRLAFPLLPDSAVQKAFRSRDVKIDGQRVDKKAVVHDKNIIEIYTQAGQIQPEIIYQDKYMAVIYKPAGINSDSDNPDEYTLQKWAQETFCEAEHQPAICHRLDNQTSGLLLISLNSKIHQEILTMFKERKVWKEYTCLTVGTPHPASALRKAFLLKDSSAGKVRVYSVPRKEAQEIITEYTVTEPGDVSRVKVILHTGRTHQIRAHMSFLGFPVLGDDVYGHREANRIYKAKKLCLCATGLRLQKEAAVLAGLNDRLFQIQPPF